MEELWSSHRHTLFFSFFTLLSNLHFLHLILFSLPISASSSIFTDMNISKAEGKRSMKDRMTEEDVGREEEEDEDGEDDNKKKRALTLTHKKGSGGGSSTQPCCQVEKCTANMSDAKPYHRRHKVCEVHAKAPVVLIGKVQQRFCQQCSRFHDLSEFDDSKRSCRRRLLGHNERRRKSSYDFQGEGSG